MVLVLVRFIFSCTHSELALVYFTARFGIIVGCCNSVISRNAMFYALTLVGIVIFFGVMTLTSLTPRCLVFFVVELRTLSFLKPH